MKRYVASYFSTFLLACAVVMLEACQSEEAGGGTTGKVQIGDEVPAFELTDTDGATVSSSSLSGQVYLLSFFDTGCPDCRKEFPVLQQIYDKYNGSVAVINVPRSQTVSEVSQYWTDSGLSMPVYSPNDKRLYYKFADSGIPRIYVVDGKGIVKAVFTDAPLVSFETMDAVLQQLLQADGNGKVNLSVRIKVAGGTRAADDDNGLNEYNISRLDLFFFDADTKKLYSHNVLENLMEDNESYDRSYDMTYVVGKVAIRVGVYNIFAIANYDYLPENIVDQDKFLDLIDNATYSAGIEPSIPFKGCVMTNRATSLLGVDLIPWVNKDYVLSLDMERVLAKLQIGVSKDKFSLTRNSRKYAEVNVTNYKLVNMNREYYLFQHKDAPTRLGNKPVFRLPYNYDDCNEDGGEYVVDPYFYDKTSSESVAAKFGNIYASWFGTFSTENFASVPAAGNYGIAYILENTSYRSSQKNAYSPGIVFKAAVSPVFVYIYDNNTRTLVEERRAEYWDRTIYLYDFNFYGSIQAINAASGLGLDELEDYTDAQLKSYGIKKCNFNMGVYETYYTYWIRHRNNTIDPMASMNYGVVRNNYYKILVTGVSGVGNSETTPDIMRDNYPNSFADFVVEE